MNRDDLADLRRFQTRAQDVLVFILKDGSDEPTVQDVIEILNEFEEDADVTVLIFNERVFSDLTKLGLAGLISLQERVEQAIAEISTRDCQGDA